MEIINIKQLVADILSKQTDLNYCGTSYPDELTKFPAAIYHTAHKPHFIDSDKRELETDWTVSIDLFNDHGSLTELSNKLVNELVKLGFSYTSGDQNLAGVKRTALVFNAMVDNQRRMVFQN
ncbi:hypothetical protein QY885_06060 [Latilactobacillus sakei]